MRNVRQIALVLATVGLAASTSVAQAVPFSITSATFSPDSGYGQEQNEKYGTLLDARFSTATFVQQNFSLNSVGDSYTFNVGTIDLEESKINTNETNYLGVSAILTFLNPVGSPLTVKAIGTAYTGPVTDSHVDYTLTWNPVYVDFGTDGQFELALNNLVFSHTGAQTQTATVRLQTDNAAVPTNNGAIPEPGTVALLGIALVGLTLPGRRKPG